MTNAKYYSLLFLAAIAMAGCARSLVQEEKNLSAENLVFTAGWEDDAQTKTVLQENGTSVWWSSSEEINVFLGNTRSGYFTSTNTEPAAETSFKGTLYFNNGVTADDPMADYWAVYPYDGRNTCDGESVTLTVRDAQSAKEGTFANSFFPAVAVSQNSKLKFYNVCGGVRFSVQNEGISSVTIRSNRGESLAGTVQVAFDQDDKPYVKGLTNGTDIITVSAPSGGFVPGQYYFAAIVPQTLSEGLTLTYNKPNQQEASYIVNKPITVNRSRFGKLDEKDSGLEFRYNPNVVVTFTDANFKAYCVANFDTNGDGEISAGEAAAVTVINVKTDNITSLGGVEYFENLDSLICDGSGIKNNIVSGKLSSLDVSNNLSLTLLRCNYNQLTQLDLSNNRSLLQLICNNNQLTTLDVSCNNNLWRLTCSKNKLSALSIGDNTSLLTLSCSHNQLSSIDISGCPSLEYLYCGDNQLSSIDVSGNPILSELGCWSNEFTTLDLSNNKILKRLDCSPGINDPVGKLTSLDVSGCTALTSLSCNNNQLTFLDVSGCIALSYLSCYNNQLTSLDVSTRTALTRLECHNNQLASLDVSKCASLEYLACGNNQISSLDVSKCTSLTVLYCHNNQLTSLDVSKCISLLNFYCDDNRLSTLDVSHCTSLEYLGCSNNQLTSLDVSNCIALKALQCYNNPDLTALWLSNGQIIETLGYDSNITTIKYKSNNG